MDIDDQPNSHLSHCSADRVASVTAAQPSATPVDWRSLDPKLAAALVLASCSVETVGKDLTSGEGYKYASTAAVVAAARKAMAVAKIALPLVEYQVRERWIFATFILVHESGAASPDINASIPMAGLRDPVKAVGATLSYLRKYLEAAVLGIGWEDRSEDVDAQGGQQQGKKHKHKPRQGEPQHKQQQAKPKPKIHPNDEYEKLLVAVRAILKSSPIEHDRFWAIATGLDGMPKATNPEPTTLPPHQLQAVIQAARSIRVLEEANAAPERWTHETYIHACEGNEFAFAMRDGEHTADGAAIDIHVYRFMTEEDKRNAKN